MKITDGWWTDLKSWGLGFDICFYPKSPLMEKACVEMYFRFLWRSGYLNVELP